MDNKMRRACVIPSVNGGKPQALIQTTAYCMCCITSMEYKE